MTLQKLEQRLSELEQVAELKCEARPLRPLASAKDTFGMFANNPVFDEIVRLGSEYREQVNSEDEAC